MYIFLNRVLCEKQITVVIFLDKRMRIRFCREKILIHVLNKKIKLITKLKVFLEISIFVKTM